MYKLIKGHKITTDNPYHDAWYATTDNYSASTDEEGNWHSDEPVGHGYTEQEAIDDLLDHLEVYP